MNAKESDARATIAAVAAAIAAIAAQVAGKAVRDTLFLSTFPVTDLPTMVIISSMVSVGVVVVTSRLFSIFGPSKVTPIAFTASSVLSLVEWSLLDVSPRAVAVAVYLHLAVFGTILISGFWSVVNERFDPKTAKSTIGRVTLGATAGGVIGGVLAERVAAYLSVSWMLPILGLTQLIAALLVIGIREKSREATVRPPESRRRARDGFSVLAKNAYLAEIATLLLVVTVAAGVVDYVFKEMATQTFTERDELLRFFAVFYTILGIATFLVQSTLANPVLQRFGIARTVATLPGAIVVGAGAMLAFPGLVAATAARAAEAALRSSLFRTGYELLYTPVDESEKRAAKTIIDAGFDRLGDLVAGVVISVILFIASVGTTTLLIVIAGMCGLVAAALAMHLHRGYVLALERRLLDHASDVDLDPMEDVLRTGAVMQTLATVDVGRLVAGPGRNSSTLGTELAALRERARSQPAESIAPVPRIEDAQIARLVELRSRDVNRVSRALADPRRFERVHAAQLVDLLAWDEVSGLATRALNEIISSCAGVVLDALLDPEQEFTIRRRVPRILARVEEKWIAVGLLAGLGDRRFEVRYQCGRALARIHSRRPEIVFDEVEVCQRVLKEVAVDRRVWESHRLLDRLEPEEDGGDETHWLDEYLADRTGRGLEHVFTLLTLILPAEPLRIAFRGLHTNDTRLRGTALVYLESVLPAPVRENLWPFIDRDESEPAATPKDKSAVLQELLESNAAIEASIAGFVPPKS